jgi:hypothetical protein
LKKIELGQAIGILANLGVVAGIIFLAVEIRQNNDQLAVQIAMNRHQIRTSDTVRFAMEPDLMEAKLKFGRDEELSEIQYERLIALYLVRFTNWELAYQLQGPEFSTVPIVANIRREPFIIELWRESIEFLDPEFARYMEESVFSRF